MCYQIDAIFFIFPQFTVICCVVSVKQKPVQINELGKFESSKNDFVAHEQYDVLYSYSWSSLINIPILILGPLLKLYEISFVLRIEVNEILI